MMNKDRLVKVLVGGLTADVLVRLGLQQTGFRFISKQSIGNTTKAMVYVQYDSKDEAYKNIRSIYSALCNRNCVTIIINDNVISYCALDYTKDSAIPYAKQCWKDFTVYCNGSDDTDELTIDRMDANTYSWIQGLNETDPNKTVTVYGKMYHVSTIVKAYGNAIKYSDALGWTFTRPIINSIRNINSFTEDQFVMKNYTGGLLQLGVPLKVYNKEGKVIDELPVYVDGTEIDSKTPIFSIATRGNRSKYKTLQMVQLSEVLEFNRYLKGIKDTADNLGVSITEFFEQGYSLCKHCGTVVRTEGHEDNRFCPTCDADIPNYIVTNAYYDDTYQDDDSDIEDPEDSME